VQPRDRPHMTRGQGGSLHLPCTTLSFATPCRFIPALSRQDCPPHTRPGIRGCICETQYIREHGNATALPDVIGLRHPIEALLRKSGLAGNFMTLNGLAGVALFGSESQKKTEKGLRCDAEVCRMTPKYPSSTALYSEIRVSRVAAQRGAGTRRDSV